MILRKAKESEIAEIWEIIGFAIEQRRLDGSSQWQDGYPNLQSIQNDFEKGYAHVVELDGQVLAYGAIIFDVEPAYSEIEGQWLTEDKYVCVHRVAVSPAGKGKGMAVYFFKELEKIAEENEVYSIKVDTNYDNAAMLHILDKLGYTYCGEVYFRGSARRAFEKVLQ
jgi:predicted GNAT superfamily acetyltransferase